ncbi:MAG: aldo/keto reductase [Gemmatimonadaceae bacterium]
MIQQEPAQFQSRIVRGRATAAATGAYASKFTPGLSGDFFRTALDGISVSSIGMGTYLGDCDDAEDSRYVDLLAAGIGEGLNVIDTAINYRCQRSERAAGRALAVSIASRGVMREEVVVCTKAGYVPLDGSPPATRAQYAEYLKSEYFDREIMKPADLVAGGHCIKPRFLADQIGRSSVNLGVDCIDLFYLHNPEQQLDILSRSLFLDSVREAFAELENQVTSGRISAYGCATWNGFRVFAANRNYLSLAELHDAAIDVGGTGHHFKAVQLPVNLAMTEALRMPTQHDGTNNVSLLENANELGVSVFASASLMQSQLTRDLPAEARSMFAGLDSDAQRAIAFVRSLPIASALVGMKTVEHLEENLGAARPVVATTAIRS